MKNKISNTLWVVGVLTFAGFCLPACNQDYTSQSADLQTIDVYIEDNFGKVEQLICAFNNKKAEDILDATIK